MRKFLFLALFSLVFSLSLLSCGMHGLFADDLSDAKIVEALQEALVLGSKVAAENLALPCKWDDENRPVDGVCTTGYLGNKQEIDLQGTTLEIALPDSVNRVLGRVESFAGDIESLPRYIKNIFNNVMTMNTQNTLSSFHGYADSLKIKLNRGAEQAAPESVALFKDAILKMSFSDARNILFGNDNTAATTYLKDQTFDKLRELFGMKLANMLNGLKINSFWSPIATTYNSFASTYSSVIDSDEIKTALSYYNSLNVSKVTMPSLPYDRLPVDLSGELSRHATGRALEGLFYMVSVQESRLRADPWGTVKEFGIFLTDTISDLLGSAFSKAKEG